MSKIPVGILGATGMVGQRFVQLLANHPRFEVRVLAASDRSVGKRYGEASTWRLEGEAHLQDWTVEACEPGPSMPEVVFSALDKQVARELEPRFRDAGHKVISNASAFRMESGVPLIIPELNPDHVDALDPSRGYIVTNPNCTCIPMTFGLKALENFGIEKVVCSSYQAVSGAGYPGESAWDILGNVRPHPGDEEQKVAEEPRKILGKRVGERVELAPFPISARCVRVPVADGHLIAVQLKLTENPPLSEILSSFQNFRAPIPLHSSPVPLLRVLEQRDRPQPKLDAMAGQGMAISIGRVEPCEVFTVKFFALAHNAIRGAAGIAIANAELLDAKKLL